jgi:hypothetical protein
MRLVLVRSCGLCVEKKIEEDFFLNLLLFFSIIFFIINEKNDEAGGGAAKKNNNIQGNDGRQEKWRVDIPLGSRLIKVLTKMA